MPIPSFAYCSSTSTVPLNSILEIQNKSMTEQCEILNQKHIDWKGDFKQTDDILIFGLKI